MIWTYFHSARLYIHKLMDQCNVHYTADSVHCYKQMELVVASKWNWERKEVFWSLATVGPDYQYLLPDHHRGIAKWIRDVHKYHSLLQHLAQSLIKKLLIAGKEKGCEVIMEWMKEIHHHLNWSATLTKPGFSNLILAKWNSFMRHAAHKHTYHHPDLLCKRCNHEEF